MHFLMFAALSANNIGLNKTKLKNQVTSITDLNVKLKLNFRQIPNETAILQTFRLIA